MLRHSLSFERNLSLYQVYSQQVETGSALFLAYLLLYFFFNSDTSLCTTMTLSAVIVWSGVPRSVALLLLQKVNRRLHLSKSKNTKFNESGQLCVFHLVSSVWSFYILITVSETLMPHCLSDAYIFRDSSCLFSVFLLQEGYLLHPSSLWENYPHSHLRYKHIKQFAATIFYGRRWNGRRIHFSQWI